MSLKGSGIIYEESWFPGAFVDPISKRHLHKACVQVLRTDGAQNGDGCRCAREGPGKLDPGREGMKAWEPQQRFPCSAQQPKIDQTGLKGSF